MKKNKTVLILRDLLNQFGKIDNEFNQNEEKNIQNLKLLKAEIEEKKLEIQEKKEELYEQQKSNSMQRLFGMVELNKSKTNKSDYLKKLVESLEEGLPNPDVMRTYYNHVNGSTLSKYFKFKRRLKKGVKNFFNFFKSKARHIEYNLKTVFEFVQIFFIDIFKVRRRRKRPELPVITETPESIKRILHVNEFIENRYSSTKSELAMNRRSRISVYNPKYILENLNIFKLKEKDSRVKRLWETVSPPSEREPNDELFKGEPDLIFMKLKNAK